MSTLDQIHGSIDARIAEIQREIAALEAARAALSGESAAVQRSVAAKSAAPAMPTAPAKPAVSAGRRRSSAKPGSNGNGLPAATAPSDAVARPRSRARAKPARARKSVEVLLAGKLDAMLRESEDGLSAITIAKRSNAGYTQVLGLLRELEGSGHVRRSGTRRTSLWRVVTDEERIAERAAELEALSAGRAA